MSRLLALLAAIMLMIGGSPAVAAAQPCDPCPPDCAMMTEMAAATVGHQSQAPNKGGPVETPCKPDMACQVSAAAVAQPFMALVAVVLTTGAVDHCLAVALAVSSHPPDRSLRPPIQL